MTGEGEESSRSSSRPPWIRSKQRLVLASASPQRRELLSQFGYSADCIPPPIEEPTLPKSSVSPAAVAEALSYFKACAVADVLRRSANRSMGGCTEPGGILVIAADTVAAYSGRLFGKPVDRAHAERILQTLAGTTHQVITGVTLLDVGSQRRMIRHEVTHVTMRSKSDAELEAYLDTGAWEGKAGAYGIQDRVDEFVERIEGSFSNVVGLPMEMLAGIIEEWAAEEQCHREVWPQIDTDEHGLKRVNND